MSAHPPAARRRTTAEPAPRATGSQAVTRALVRSGRLAGAAVDVLTSEPPALDHPLLHHEDIVVTPHVAWCSEEADRDVWQLAAAEVARVLGGKAPRWAVNGAPNGARR